jgi:anti-sigma regulatory factor (Ser/Thr protein kinase)
MVISMSGQQEFEPRPQSVTAARRFVTELAAEAGVAEQAVRWMELVTSELATNAVRHARTAFLVELSIDDDEATVSVRDGVATPPRLREIDVPDPGGRGLVIISRSSTSWGVDAYGTGKRVWCTIDHIT